MARNYAKEYANYHSRPEQIKKRSSRNKARRLAVANGKAKKGDGKELRLLGKKEFKTLRPE